MIRFYPWTWIRVLTFSCRWVSDSRFQRARVRDWSRVIRVWQRRLTTDHHRSLRGLAPEHQGIRGPIQAVDGQAAYCLSLDPERLAMEGSAALRSHLEPSSVEKRQRHRGRSANRARRARRVGRYRNTLDCGRFGLSCSLRPIISLIRFVHQKRPANVATS